VGINLPSVVFIIRWVTLGMVSLSSRFFIDIAELSFVTCSWVDAINFGGFTIET